jgi:hypothetical protein
MGNFFGNEVYIEIAEKLLVSNRIKPEFASEFNPHFRALPFNRGYKIFTQKIKFQKTCPLKF